MISSKERISIEIDPDTLEYSMTVNFVKLEHIEGVLRDILRKIEEDDLGSQLHKVDNYGNPIN